MSTIQLTRLHLDTLGTIYYLSFGFILRSVHFTMTRDIRKKSAQTLNVQAGLVYTQAINYIFEA